ncbi:hypothetical protein CmeUKMEL1_05900 [Cryptosporidium meleagridis]|uniref:Uncharacterized protein n=1 Tax=Cryptosporidium meleagridis TaxID=93969 RepID=A0A2P4YZ85_9CRYT|nr:hypothetical protein CmeUKMEL1_05900 [Cryptosporidium meleagridis]
MEGVKYSRGGKVHVDEERCGGGRGEGHVGMFVDGKGNGRGGGTYRGNRFGKGNKIKSGSIYRYQNAKFDFTGKLQNSTETTVGPDELEKSSESADFSNKVVVDTSDLLVISFGISPEKKSGEKIGVISNGISSTEASEYCKSQGSSQNPSPLGGCQEKFNTNSNFYDDSKHLSNYKHYRKNHFQSAYKGRREVFNKTQSEKAFEVKKESEKRDLTNPSPEEPAKIEEVKSINAKKDGPKLPAFDEKIPDQESILESPSRMSDKNSKSTETLIKEQDKNSNSNSQMIRDVINWMMERQGEAIQWLKENGKYPQEEFVQNSVRNPRRFSQDRGFRGKKQSWIEGERNTKGKNQRFPAKHKGQKKDAFSSYSPKTLVNPANQDKSSNSTSDCLELSQCRETSKQFDTKILNKDLGQNLDSRAKQKFGYNRRFSREKTGNFQFQNKIKENESYLSSRTRNDSIGGEKSTNRNSSFNTPTKYKNHYYKKESVRKDL